MLGEEPSCLLLAVLADRDIPSLGGLNTYNTSSALAHALRVAVLLDMPLRYVVTSEGRTGAQLRCARAKHELLATGPSARIGALLPHHTTTTAATTDGRPLEVKVPFALATWLAVSALTFSNEVASLHVYMYVIGAERLGTALDVVLASLANFAPVSPSVLRRAIVSKAEVLRSATPILANLQGRYLFNSR